MELCTVRTISNLPHSGLVLPDSTHLRCRPSLSFRQHSRPRNNPGLLYYKNSSLRSTMSEETSTGPSQYAGEESSVATMEDIKRAEKTSSVEIVQEEAPKEDFTAYGQELASEFLDKLDIKLDSQDTYSTLLLGGTALVALWISSAVVGAIDSIPLFPKLMEIVGLGYTVWFTTRYLILKESREELASKIEGIKKQVIGSNDD
ncbi:hypothetical protein NMG60_11007443 [Bertholletia excelsa]